MNGPFLKRTRRWSKSFQKFLAADVHATLRPSEAMQ